MCKKHFFLKKIFFDTKPQTQKTPTTHVSRGVGGLNLDLEIYEMGKHAPVWVGPSLHLPKDKARCYKRTKPLIVMIMKKTKKKKKYLFQCRPSEYWTPCMDVPAGAPLMRGGSERDGSGTIPGIAGAAY